MQLLSSRVLMSLGMIVFVGALAVGSTGAFFSDTETSTGNTFAAGAIDLQIDNTSYGFDWNNPAVPLEQATGAWGPNAANSWAQKDLTNELFFSFRDLKPGDYGEDTISIHVANNDAYACMAFNLTSTPDNGINEPEADALDVTDGANGGELQNYLSFMFWYDDGDNVLEVGEDVIPELSGLPGSIFTGGWLPIAEAGDAPLPGDTTRYIGKGWCFGAMTAAPVAQDGINTVPPSAPARVGFTCDGTGNHNVAQSDGIVVDVAFHAVQSRNNATFLCSSLPPLEGEVVVDPAINQSDLATSTAGVIANPLAWFFYNDTNDTIMTIDQFSGTGGQNHMELVAGEEGAKMVLDTGTDPRYNIATAQFGNIALSSISPLTFRIYDDSASAETPFLHFNVDFFNTGAFQSRLVMVPTVAAGNLGVPTDTWTTVDAINGGTAMWTYSGAFWPAGGSEPGTNPGTTPKTWASILADYPLIETLASPASFFGVRVGHPGPAGETSFVSSINFDGTVYDFEI